jgi:transposase
MCHTNAIVKNQEEPMRKSIKLMSIDLAKRSFFICAKNEDNQVILSKKLTALKLKELLEQTPSCHVVMEGCGSAHYWARFAQSKGHRVGIIPAQHVKPFVTSSHKNDRNDALAILEASQRPYQKLSGPKTSWQQELQALHRMRSYFVKKKVGLSNQLRGLLFEYGIVIAKGDANLKKALIAITTEEGVFSDFFMNGIKRLGDEFSRCEESITYFIDEIMRVGEQSDVLQRLQNIPGVGPLSASAFYAAVGNGTNFKCGRQVSAWLGLVPKQQSTGGRTVLLGVVKRGDAYVKQLLIHGARSHVRSVSLKGATDQRTKWVEEQIKLKGVNKTAVAVANRNARIMWALIKMGTEYVA